MKRVLATMVVLVATASAARADPAKDEAKSDQDTWRAAFAGSVMLTGAGAMMIVWGHNLIDTAEHGLCTGDYSGTACGHPPPPAAVLVDDFNNKGDAGQTLARVGLGVTIAGVVLTGITGYKGFAGGKKDESGVTVTPTVGPSGAGASLSMRW